MNRSFTELSNNELYDVDGGIPLLLGVLAAGGIVVGTAFVVAGTVYVVGKGVQYVGDKVFN